MLTINPLARVHTRNAPRDDRAIASAAALLGRLLIRALFFISGVSKIAAPAATIHYIASVGLPFPQLGLVIGIAVELIVAPALLLGYRTRLAAAVIATYCVATAVFFHRFGCGMTLCGACTVNVDGVATRLRTLPIRPKDLKRA